MTLTEEEKRDFAERYNLNIANRTSYGSQRLIADETGEETQPEICDSCGSNRILYFDAHTADSFLMEYKDLEYDSYPPMNMNISDDGDGVQLKFCLDCGKIQGHFPIEESTVIAEFNGEDVDEEDKDE